MQTDVKHWFPHAQLIEGGSKQGAHYVIPKQEMDHFLRHLPFFLDYPQRKNAPKLTLEEFERRLNLKDV